MFGSPTAVIHPAGNCPETWIFCFEGAYAVKVWFSRRLRESWGEYSLTQEIKVGSPVHAALDQFETVDLALEQSI